MNAACAVGFISAMRSHLNQYSTHIYDSRDDTCVLPTKNEFRTTSKVVGKRTEDLQKFAGPT